MCIRDSQYFMAKSEMFNTLSHCAQEVRRQDWDRFLFTLFAPMEVREDIFTFLAFNAEISKKAEKYIKKNFMMIP